LCCRAVCIVVAVGFALMLWLLYDVVVNIVISAVAVVFVVNTICQQTIICLEGLAKILIGDQGPLGTWF